MHSRERRILIPTIDSDDRGVNKLAALHQELVGCKSQQIVFDFSNARFLGPTAVAYLAAIRAYAEQRECRIAYDFRGCRAAVHEHITHCGLIDDEREVVKDTTIALRRFSTLEPIAIYEFLVDEWLARSRLTVTQAQTEYLASSVAELFVNGFNHSRSPIGVVSYGQFFPRLKILKLVVLDLGIGIPDSVREKVERPLGWLKDGKAIEWAFKRGYTTTRGTPRGLGLAILKDFVLQNGGTVKVYSKSGYASMGTSDHFYSRETIFPGTAIEIALKSLTFEPARKTIQF